MKGIRFVNQTFYKGQRGLEINAANGSAIGDIFVLPGAQFDGFFQNAVYINADGRGTIIDDIHINGVYMRGLAQVGGVLTQATNGGSVSTVMVKGGWIASLTRGARAVAFGAGTRGSSVDGLTVMDCDCAGQDIIALHGNGNSARNNTLGANPGQTVGASAFISVAADADYTTVAGNNTGGFATTPVLNLSRKHINIVANQ